MTNPNHTPSPSTITPDSVKERLFIEQTRLEQEVSKARKLLEEAEANHSDFLQSVRNGEARCYAFGLCEWSWKKVSYLPNGEEVSLEEQGGYQFLPNSICSDLIALENAGLNIEGLLKEYRDEREEWQCSRWEHSHYEGDLE